MDFWESIKLSNLITDSYPLPSRSVKFGNGHHVAGIGLMMFWQPFNTSSRWQVLMKSPQSLWQHLVFLSIKLALSSK